MNNLLIQPHGVLLVVKKIEEKNIIIAVSDNVCDYFGPSIDDLLDKDLKVLLSEHQINVILDLIPDESLHVSNWLTFDIQTKNSLSTFDVIIHNHFPHIMLEFSVASDSKGKYLLNTYHNLIKEISSRLEQTHSLNNICDIVTSKVLQMTGMQQVMLFRFDEQSRSRLFSIKKSGNLDIEFDIDKFFSSVDISHYLNSYVRVVPSVEYVPSKVVTHKNFINEDFDLEHSLLRDISSHKREYLEKLGIKSFISMSIIIGTRLWGVVVGISRQDNYIRPFIRSSCELLAQLLSSNILNLTALEAREDQDRVNRVVKEIHNRLREKRSLKEILPEILGQLIKALKANGLAIIINSEIYSCGAGIPTKEITRFAAWLRSNYGSKAFSTDNLVEVYDDQNGGTFAVLALPLNIDQGEYIIWFREKIDQSYDRYGHYHRNENLQNKYDSFISWSWKEIEINGAREIALDISNKYSMEASELNKKLILKTKELQKSNEDLKEFAYVASHDLKEPLKMVTSYCELLEKRYSSVLDDKGLKYLSFAVDGARRLDRLIDSLLEYSKVGRLLDSDFEIIVFNELFSTVVTNLEVSIKEKSAKIIIDENIPNIKGHYLGLVQLFQNLMSNSLKFSKGQDVVIRIYHIANEDFLDIYVEDNGIGIDPTFKEQVFKIFERLHTASDYPGTGIGLAICKKIVESHSGKIWIQEKDDAGTLFVIRLPTNTN